jgi:hypothetical protein
MQQSDLHKLLDEVVKAKGTIRVEAALTGLLSSEAPDVRVLTIVANAGVHDIPSAYLRGEVYEASRGDWDAGTEQALSAELRRILSALVKTLKSKRWDRIYLIPTGHPILSVQIKTMVYRILRLNTVDLYYKAGAYFEVDLDQRAIALDEGRRA